ncbi:MAG: ABC transporter ATP-binding protein [Victivallales bacterium]|nr:ABC transporter ATP-binding protein [Victivallales bacterium]
MKPIIKINNVCFKYDSREVLHDITLTISEGMFAVIVGPNGGGKTTLLKLILGLLKPRYGSISVFGMPPEQARTSIGYVPQAILFDDSFPATVLDIVLMGRIERHFFSIYSKKDKETALRCLKDVGLDELAERPFAALSGGERQRVLIAQAIASQPKLLILDEPGANLDPASAKTLFSLLKKLNQELTILMVSHNLEIVSNVVSHIICLNHTADMHDINQMHCDPLTGEWLHIQHDSCPVADADLHPDKHCHPGE